MEQQKIRLVALDLDGTLLTTDKRLSEENYKALQEAADRGIEIVPASGRIYRVMPEVIRDLPFVHYAIGINGAQVYDVVNDRMIYKAEIDPDRALEIIRFYGDYPLAYNAYVDNQAYMSETLWKELPKHIKDPIFLDLIMRITDPVDDLETYLEEVWKPSQKINAYTSDAALKEMVMKEIRVRFPEILVSAGHVQNIELNAPGASKGEALKHLAAHLHIPLAETAALGDGLNDISMLKAAGTSAAMGNALREAKDAADFITDTNDNDGVAKALYRLNII